MKHQIAFVLIALLACTARAQTNDTNGMSTGECSRKVNAIMVREGGGGPPISDQKLLEKGRVDLEAILSQASDQKAIDIVNIGLAGNYARRGDVDGALKIVALISDPTKRERRRVEVYWYAKGFQGALDELAKLIGDKSIPPEHKLMIVSRFKIMPDAKDNATLMGMAATVLAEAKIDENNIKEATGLYNYCKDGAAQGVLAPEKFDAIVEALSLQPNELGTKARSEPPTPKRAKTK